MAKEHCIQVRVDEDEWDRAVRAAKANGLPTVSALCRFLLQREYERWGLSDGPSAAAPSRTTKKGSRGRSQSPNRTR